MRDLGLELTGLIHWLIVSVSIYDEDMTREIMVLMRMRIEKGGGVIIGRDPEA